MRGVVLSFQNHADSGRRQACHIVRPVVPGGGDPVCEEDSTNVDYLNVLPFGLARLKGNINAPGVTPAEQAGNGLAGLATINASIRPTVRDPTSTGTETSTFIRVGYGLLRHTFTRYSIRNRPK